MPAPTSHGARAVSLALVALMVLAPLSGTVSALPGDLSVDMELDEDALLAQPTLEDDPVVLHGNVTFQQPIWQYASASLSCVIDRNWTVTVNPVSVSRRGEGTEHFTVTVTVPSSARGQDVAALAIEAEYSTRFGESSTVSDTASVGVAPWHAFDVNTTGALEVVVPQGRNTTLMLPLRNLGNEVAYFTADVPYWYGLRRYGIVADAPSSLGVPHHSSGNLELNIDTTPDTVPREYVFQVAIVEGTLPRGGEGVRENPRVLEVHAFVHGASPPEDPYSTWELGDGPSSLPQWTEVFGSLERRNRPDVSPDGTMIAYSQQVPGGNGAIYLAGIDGAWSLPLTRGDSNDHSPVISPDGKRVAFARDPDRILVVDLNGTLLREVGTEHGSVNITDWAPSEDRLLFDVSHDIYELDLRRNGTRLLAGEPVDQWGAVYSPEGSRIYYISYEAAGPTSEVWSMSSDGTDHRQVTFNDVAERFVSVSPNGKRLAFSMYANGTGNRLCVMDLDGTGARWFSDDTHVGFLVRWMPDGEALVVEVQPPGAPSSNIKRIQYPWDDAGFEKASGDAGGGGTASALLDHLLNPVLWLALLVLVVVIGGPLAYQRARARRRAERVERLKEITGRDRSVEAVDGTAEGAPTPADRPYR